MKIRKAIFLILAFLMVVSSVEGCTNVNEDENKITGEEPLPSAVPCEYAEAKDQFRYDNFADGRLPDSLLDSMNGGALAFASNLMYYEWRLQKGIERGEKWILSESEDVLPQTTAFDKLLTEGKYGANCFMLANWAFYDMGITKEGTKFYGAAEGEFGGADTVGKYIGAVCNIITWGERYNFSELGSYGHCTPGNIFLCSGHTYIYLGDGKFIASGNDSSNYTDDNGNVFYKSWVVTSAPSTNITYQIVFKDEYVPKNYRNVQGKIVSNPLYNEATSIEYKEGVSSEKLLTTKGKINKDTFGYYDGNRTNVLANSSFTKQQGFRLKSITGADNLVDTQIYYDGTTDSYAEFKLLGEYNDYKNPTKWYDANGNVSETKDETHKYFGAFYTSIEETKTVNGFALYSQNLTKSGEEIKDIEGFDILVSEDGKNWNVVYSLTDSTTSNVWKSITDEKALSSKGDPTTHYIEADFEEVNAKYIMFAITQPRDSANPGWFTFTEFMVFEK